MNEQKQREYDSLNTIRENAISMPETFMCDTAKRLRGSVVEEWSESPDFLLDCGDYYLGLEHFEAYGHSVETAAGKRTHAMTDIWRRAEKASLTGEDMRLDEEADRMRAEMIGESLGSKMGNFADPAILIELMKGLDYSVSLHMKKVDFYINRLHDKFGDSKQFQIGFLIDWHIDPLTLHILRLQRLQIGVEFFRTVITNIMRAITLDGAGLDYLYMNILWTDTDGQEQHYEHSHNNVVQIVIDKAGMQVERNISFGIALKEAS
jgi:hypothetical protein